MLLSSVVEQMKLELELEPCTLQQYTRSVNRFGVFLQRLATEADLTNDKVNAWINWLPSQFSLGPTSTLNHRSGLLRVWNFCADVLQVCEPARPSRIKRPKKPPMIVKAWSLGDIDTLLQCASELEGTLRCGIPASDFMTAWLWLGYESAFRPGDLRILLWSNVDLTENTVTIVQHKTNAVHTRIFGTETRDALLRIKKHGQKRVFPLEKYGVRRWETILYREATKRGFVRAARQGIGTLRKTHATEIFKEYGLEAAAESLGHRSGTQTVKNHYVDARASSCHRPPSPTGRAG